MSIVWLQATNLTENHSTKITIIAERHGAAPLGTWATHFAVGNGNSPCAVASRFVIFALKVQHNLAQGNALGKYRTILYAPCKGSKITSVALLPQGFVGARHASPVTSYHDVYIRTACDYFMAQRE